MFTLETVVPWGRSFDEYCAMFDLSEQDLALKILDCGGGPASFNAESTDRGGAVTSCDPIYEFTSSQLEDRIAATSREILDQSRRNMTEFVWTSIQSVEKLGELRMSAMRTFLADYPRGRQEGRYVSGALPTLPFADGSFDLALSSHLLFLYTEQFDASFHCAAIDEMCRVAGEVRIFPLLALGAVRSRHVDSVIAAVRRRGLDVSIDRVPYEFQRGGNQMMRIRRRAAASESPSTC